MAIDDETDLEAAAEFDIREFLEARGIDDPFNEFDEEVEKIPKDIINHTLEKKFAVPYLGLIKYDGNMEMMFSNEIVEPSFSDTLYYINKENELLIRRLNEKID